MPSRHSSRRGAPSDRLRMTLTSANRGAQRRQVVRRAGFMLNSGYRTQTTQPRQTTQNPIHPSSIHLNYSNTFIDVSANNISNNHDNNNNTDNLTDYHSNFLLDDLNIRFFHNTPITNDNAQDIIDGVIRNINRQEINLLLENITQDNLDNELINNTLYEENDFKNELSVILEIKANMSTHSFEECENTIKNDTCPISLCEFERQDKVSIFNLCKHAILKSHEEKYIEIFKKCPLCNHPLF
jgi:hypothetical protein